MKDIKLLQITQNVQHRDVAIVFIPSELKLIIKCVYKLAVNHLNYTVN